MKIGFLPRALDALDRVPPSVRKALFKQLDLLNQNLRHPSLRAKKYDERNDVWQARVNRDWRFYFILEGQTCTVVNVTPHPK